jgi:hypothetical protein
MSNFTGLPWVVEEGVRVVNVGHDCGYRDYRFELFYRRENGAVGAVTFPKGATADDVVAFLEREGLM